MKTSIIIVATVLVGAVGLYVWKTSGAYTVSSEDKSAVLTFSRSAMPSGISIEDISVKKVDASEFSALEKIFEPIAVYRFSPEEIVFQEPMQLSITVPDNSAGVFPNALQIEGGRIEQIPELKVERDESGNFRLSGEIKHFSVVVVNLGPVSLIMERDLGAYKVGDSFTVPVRLITKKLYNNNKIEVEYATLTSGGEFTHGNAWIVQPEKISDTPPSGTTFRDLPNSAPAEGRFTCMNRGRARIFYEISFRVKQKYTDKGIWEERVGLEILLGYPLPDYDPVYDSFYTTSHRWFLDYSDVRCVAEDPVPEAPSQPQVKDAVPQPVSLPNNSTSFPVKDSVRRETPSEICSKFKSAWFPEVETYDDGCGSPGAQHQNVAVGNVLFKAVFSFFIMEPGASIAEWENFATTDYSTSLGLKLGESKDEYGRHDDFQKLSGVDFGVRRRSMTKTTAEGVYRVRHKRCVTDMLLSGAVPSADASYAGAVFAATDAKIQEHINILKSLAVCNP